MLSQKVIIGILLAVCVIFNILGDYFAKSWSANGNQWRVWLAAVFYCTLTAGWLVGLKTMQHLGRWTCIWTILSLVAGVMMSQVIFAEPMTVKTWVGVGLAILSLVLLV